jgi:hypothetical protein
MRTVRHGSTVEMASLIGNPRWHENGGSAAGFLDVVSLTNTRPSRWCTVGPSDATPIPLPI